MKPINSNFLSLASSSQLINNPTTNHYYDVGTTQAQYRHYTGLSQAVTAVAEAAVAVAAALQKSFHYTLFHLSHHLV